MATVNEGGFNQPQWFKDLVAGIKQGIAASPEDRREALTAIRELEGKSEGPRALYTLAQNPILDAIRQRNTFGQKQGLQTLGLPRLTDDSLVYRANKGLIAGPSPEQVVPKELWLDNQALPADPIQKPKEKPEDYERRAAPYRKVRERNIETYKEGLRTIPGWTKAGHALSSLGADLAQDTTRGLWWLINASQAVVNLGSEGLAGAANPDLFGATPLNDLELAERQGLIRFVKPPKTQLEETYSEPQPDFMGSAESTEEQRTQAQMLIDAEKRARADARNYVATSPGVKNVRGGFKRRRFNPNLVNVAAMLPAAVGINAGIGLLGGEDSGTMIPGTGRKQGYAAAVPSELDPTQTMNPGVEALTKFFLGREGQLLPWTGGFQTERPDVSREEYNRYKAYERDRSIDINPLDDGIVNLGGVLKANFNNDAIHGREVQFLGKNISMNESVIPVAGALIGTALGGLAPNLTRIRRRRNNPNLPTYVPEKYFKKDKEGNVVKDKLGVRQLDEDYDWESPDLKTNKYNDPDANWVTKLMGNIPEVAPRDATTGKIVRNENLEDNKVLRKIEQFFIQQPETGKGIAKFAPDTIRRDRQLGVLFGGGMAGLVGGAALGSAIEDERRRRNFEENYPGIEYEAFKSNARQSGARQKELIRNNPNARAEKRENKTSFNNRGYQQALMDEALEKQSMIDQVANAYLRSQMQGYQDESLEALNKSQEIEDEIKRRREGKSDEEELTPAVRLMYS